MDDFECKCLYYFRLGKRCKHVAALLLHILREVQLICNRTCTSKPQQWHKPATLRTGYSATRISNIYMKKMKPGRHSLLDQTKQRSQWGVFDPRAGHHQSPLIWCAEHRLKFTNATDGNCGILLYKANWDNYKSSPDVNLVIQQELVETRNQILDPPTLPELTASVNKNYPDLNVDAKCKMFWMNYIFHLNSHALSDK